MVGFFNPLLSLTALLTLIDSFDHDRVQAIINKIVEQGDNSHSAIKKTLGNAQQGQAFAESVVLLCGALTEKQNTSENLGELLLNLITIAEKAHRRSIKARDQLKGVSNTLSEVYQSKCIEQSMLMHFSRYPRT